MAYTKEQIAITATFIAKKAIIFPLDPLMRSKLSQEKLTNTIATMLKVRLTQLVKENPREAKLVVDFNKPFLFENFFTWLNTIGVRFARNKRFILKINGESTFDNDNTLTTIYKPIKKAVSKAENSYMTVLSMLRDLSFDEANDVDEISDEEVSDEEVSDEDESLANSMGTEDQSTQQPQDEITYAVCHIPLLFSVLSNYDDRQAAHQATTQDSATTQLQRANKDLALEDKSEFPELVTLPAVSAYAPQISNNQTILPPPSSQKNIREQQTSLQQARVKDKESKTEDETIIDSLHCANSQKMSILGHPQLNHSNRNLYYQRITEIHEEKHKKKKAAQFSQPVLVQEKVAQSEKYTSKNPEKFTHKFHLSEHHKNLISKKKNPIQRDQVSKPRTPTINSTKSNQTVAKAPLTILFNYGSSVIDPQYRSLSYSQKNQLTKQIKIDLKNPFIKTVLANQIKDQFMKSRKKR